LIRYQEGFQKGFQATHQRKTKDYPDLIRKEALLPPMRDCPSKRQFISSRIRLKAALLALALWARQGATGMAKIVRSDRQVWGMGQTRRGYNLPGRRMGRDKKFTTSVAIAQQFQKLLIGRRDAG
jgi:hypothetical protein